MGNPSLVFGRCFFMAQAPLSMFKKRKMLFGHLWVRYFGGSRTAPTIEPSTFGTTGKRSQMPILKKRHFAERPVEWDLIHTIYYHGPPGLWNCWRHLARRTRRQS